MIQSMRCPSCGCQIDPDLRFAHMVVCGQCRSAIVLDEEALRLSGTMAVLAQTPGPLHVGGSGRLSDKHHFSVLGRVRYGYKQGFWDEWYIALRDGANAWIGEDENNFSLEMLSPDDSFEFDYLDIQPGQRIKLGEKTYHVDEKGVAVCEGGEGQLPFAISSGEHVPFVDLSCGKRFATIEFETDGATRVFLGKRLALAEIQMDSGARDAGAGWGGWGSSRAERAGADEAGGRERAIVRGDRTKALGCFACAAPLDVENGRDGQIDCGYCGAANDLSGGQITCQNCSVNIPVPSGSGVKSITCPGCRLCMDISGGEPSPLGKLLDKHKPPGIYFTLGQRCRFRGHSYVVAGIVRSKGREDDEFFLTTEYLLYSKEAGYRWLGQEMGHFSLGTEIDDRPGIFPTTWKRPFRFGGRVWKVFAEGTTRIQWIDGQFPWVAKVGDQSGYRDAICPPYLLSQVSTENEQEYFQEEYLPAHEVAEGFGVSVEDLPRPVGVGANQPYVVSLFRKQARFVIGAFLVLSLILLGGACLRSGREIGAMRFSATDYAAEHLSPPFTVTTPNTVCRAAFFSPVRNQWVYLDAALVNSNDQAVLEFSTEMAYYHGVSGGESWSEGSQKDNVAFKVEEPGEYRLLVKGESSRGVGVTATIYQDVTLKRYWIILVCGFIAWLVGDWLHRVTFESRRWGVDDDDD